VEEQDITQMIVSLSLSLSHTLPHPLQSNMSMEAFSLVLEKANAILRGLFAHVPLDKVPPLPPPSPSRYGHEGGTR